METIFKQLKTSEAALAFAKTLSGPLAGDAFIRLNFENQLGTFIDYFETKHIYLQIRHDFVAGARIGIAMHKANEEYTIIKTTRSKVNTVSYIELVIYYELVILVFDHLDLPF